MDVDFRKWGPVVSDEDITLLCDGLRELEKNSNMSKSTAAGLLLAADTIERQRRYIEQLEQTVAELEARK